jgi:hypothetical protein
VILITQIIGIIERKAKCGKKNRRVEAAGFSNQSRQGPLCLILLAVTALSFILTTAKIVAKNPPSLSGASSAIALDVALIGMPGAHYRARVECAEQMYAAKIQPIGET